MVEPCEEGRGGALELSASSVALAYRTKVASGQDDRVSKSQDTEAPLPTSTMIINSVENEKPVTNLVGLMGASPVQMQHPVALGHREYAGLSERIKTPRLACVKWAAQIRGARWNETYAY